MGVTLQAAETVGQPAPETMATAAAAPDVLLNDGLAATIHLLLGQRMSRLVLPPAVMALYQQRTGQQSRRMMASWAIRIALINLVIMLFDFKIEPERAWGAAVCMHLIIFLSFLLSAQMLVNQRLAGRAHLIIVPPCLITVAFTGVLGMLCGTPDCFTIYVTMGMTIIFVGIAFLPIGLIDAAWMGGLSLAIVAVFVAVCDLPNGFEKLQMIVFFTSTVIALLEGRRIQYKYQYRAFLLQIQEELRSAEAGQRNERLSSMAYTDRLTDIPNRRYFDEMADTINAMPEANLPLSLCLFDIDHFKNLNDRMGHLQGDRCLRRVANCLRAHLRNKNDVLARYGGEEFVIVLPNTDAESAQIVAERIRAAVLELAHPNPGTEAGLVTISAGIAATTRAGVKVETLLKEADEALYRAKAAGRNRVGV